MAKIKLELDALSVESFAPAGAVAERGTVRGHASLYWEDCYPGETQDAAHTCDYTCQSCNGTCYVQTCAPGCGPASAGCPPYTAIGCESLEPRYCDMPATDPGAC